MFLSCGCCRVLATSHDWKMLTALVWCTAMAATCCSIRTAGRGRMITALQHRCPHQAAGRIIRPTRTIARAATTSVVMMMKHHRSVGAPSVVERQPDLTTRQPCCSRRSWRRNPRVCAPQRLINTRADQKTCYKEEAEEEEGAFGERISTVRSSRRKSSVSWGKATKLFSTALAVLAPSATEGELSYRAERGQGVGYHGDDICGLQVNYLTANGKRRRDEALETSAFETANCASESRRCMRRICQHVSIGIGRGTVS